MNDLIVTGITGFLGRQLVYETMFRKTYNHIYGMSRRWADQEKLQKFCGKRVTMTNGDIRDLQSSQHLLSLSEYIPDVIHTAAYKHISMAQTNAYECFDVNVNGTQTLLNAFRNNGIRNFVFISTDKAAGPVNVYGQSKAIAEQLVLNFGGVVLRFGNVWNSTGSLIQKWHKEMKKDDPLLEITEPSMTRYFFGIDDVVDYVLLSTSHKQCKIIPNLKSTTVEQLAVAFQEAYKKKAKTKIIGIRPGEKLHEQMTTPEELSVSEAKVIHGKYLKLTPGSFGKLPHDFSGLWSSEAAERFTQEELIEMIKE